MTLRGKRVLVTGASSGIGHAMALALAKEGAHLAVSARRADRLDQLTKRIEVEWGGRAIALVADLSRRGEAAELARRAVEALGGVDGLVNNAGVGLAGAQWIAADRDEAREVFETNFWSPLALIQSLVPAMRQRGEGFVVNVTSMVQIAAVPYATHYGASKAALANATETLRQELRGSGVLVVEVIPGPVETAMQNEARLAPGFAAALARSPIGDPDDLARLVIRALGRRRRRVVYPRVLRAAYELPALVRWSMGFSTRHVDASDTRLRRSGSFGDPEARQAREAWERARSG
jgi:short-subunit dehydrogenase